MNNQKKWFDIFFVQVLYIFFKKFDHKREGGSKSSSVYELVVLDLVEQKARCNLHRILW